MNLPRNLVGTAFFGLVCSLGLGAQTAAQTTQMDSGSQKMMKGPDIKFADEAAQSGKAEVELGQLALQKADNPDVKAFAQRMIDDHTKANEQLQQIASQQNITLPTTVDQKDLMLKNKLQNLSGPKFDKEYMKTQVKDHEKDIKEFEKESNDGADPAIKGFASQTLPILQSHLQMAKSADAKVK